MGTAGPAWAPSHRQRPLCKLACRGWEKPSRRMGRAENNSSKTIHTLGGRKEGETGQAKCHFNQKLFCYCQLNSSLLRDHQKLKHKSGIFSSCIPTSGGSLCKKAWIPFPQKVALTPFIDCLKPKPQPQPFSLE